MSTLAMKLLSIGIMTILALNLAIMENGSGQSGDPPLESILTTEVSPNSDLFFIENIGQLDREDIDVYLEGRTMVGIGSGMIQFTYREDNRMLSTVQLEFIDSKDVDPVLSDPTPTRYNYFQGSTRENWMIGARSFSNILYKDIFPDIDLKIHSKDLVLKYDIIVHPGGNPGDLRIRYTGADNVKMMGDEHLHITCGSLTIDDGPLYIYQDTEIQGSYSRSGDIFGIDLDEYDPSTDLVIDPLLLASTYYGGNNWDKLPMVEMDHLDRPVIAITAESSNMPTSSGSYSSSFSGERDIALAKFSRDLSSLLASSYFGGSSYDTLGGLDVGGDGKIYITGSTNSSNIPITSGAYIETSPVGRDGFIACFNPDLSDLHYSTYIGGNAADFSKGIDVDSSGAAYITGYTYSSDFDTSTSAFQKDLVGQFDAYVLKLLPDGSEIEFSSLIGGEGDLWGEIAYDIHIDSQKRPIIVGNAVSSTYPVTNGSYDTSFGHYMGFVTKFTNDGTDLEFSTYFGNGTYILSLDLGPEENIYLTGETVSVSGDYPVTSNAYDKDLSGLEDAFFAVLKNDGSDLLYSTFLGENEKFQDDDEFEEKELGHTIKADSDGRAYIVGETDSINYPITIGALDSNLNEREGFITIFKPDWSDLEYSSFIGGNDEDICSGIALNQSQGMYICGETYSNYPNHDFPTTDGAHDTSFDSAYEGYLAYFKLDSYPPSAPLGASYMSEDSYINLTWNPPASDGGEEVLFFRIYRGNSPAISSMSHMAKLDESTHFYNDTSAVNGRVYYYGIRAENIVGKGEWVVISGSASTRPGAPNIYDIEAGDKFLNLSWNKPYDDGGISEIFYTTFIGSNKTALEIAQSGVKDTWFNFTGLNNGDTYYLGVQAANWRGMGPISEIVKGTPLIAPSRPLDLKAVLSPFIVHLSWTAPEENGGSSNILYDVYMGANLSVVEKVEESLNTTNTDIPVSMIGVQRTIFVRAKNELGPGKRSDLLNITPLGDLSRPKNLSLFEGGDHINLTWLPPDFNGGARSLTYTIYYGHDEWNLSILTTGVEGTEYTFENVTPGIEYFLAVSANNSMWEGPLSDINSTTPYQVPSPPMNLVGTIGDGSINLSWNPPIDFGGDENVTFELFFAQGNGTLNYMRWLNKNQTVVRGLENGIEYAFSVRAFNIKGRSRFSNIIILKPMKVPSSPRNLHYIEGDGSLNLTWDPPIDSGGSKILTYTLILGENENELVPIAENISRTWYLIDNLTNGRLYYISIISWNEMGPCEDPADIMGVPLTLPSPPVNLNITWQEDHVLVKWDPPEEDGGSDVELYIIFRGPDPGNMTKIKAVQGSFLTYTDEDVSPETNYYYHIQCETSLGRSKASEKFYLEYPVEESEEIDLGLPLMIGGGILILLLLILGLIILIRNRRKDWGIEE